jgi:transcription antitermination factor NusG
MNERKNWYAIYCRPRTEKKLARVLTEKAIENYCPVTKTKKQWSDRIKYVEEPLFKSYVFVKSSAENLTTIRKLTGVVNFVYWLGKPATLRQIEIDRIKRFLNEYESVMVEPLHIVANEQVVVTAGILMDKQAKVLALKGNKVQLEFENFGYKLVAYVDRNNVKRHI